MIDGYKNLTVWQKSIDLVEHLYIIVKLLPKEETYGLSDQIRRAAISIPSNIAEGANRNSTKEYIQFLYIALGSAAEVETQIIIASRIGYVSDIETTLERINEVKKMINALITSLKKKLGSGH